MPPGGIYSDVTLPYLIPSWVPASTNPGINPVNSRPSWSNLFTYYSTQEKNQNLTMNTLTNISEQFSLWCAGFCLQPDPHCQIETLCN